MDVAVDYYATLGVARQADDAAIRRAYRKLMRATHPDVNASADAEARAKAINEAYACLHDPSKRAAYDGRRRARRHAQRPAPVHSTRPFQPTWGEQHVDKIYKDAVVPKRWKVISLGLAAVATIVTFTMTSSVEPTGAAPTLPVTLR